MAVSQVNYYPPLFALGNIVQTFLSQYWPADEQAAPPGEQLETLEKGGDAAFPPLVRCPWGTGWRPGNQNAMP